MILVFRFWEKKTSDKSLCTIMPSVRDIPRIWCCHFEQALILVICLHKRALPTKKNWHPLVCMFFLCHFLRASPPVLSLWLQRVKFMVQKSKCASLAQEIGFSASTSCILLCWNKAQHNYAPPKKSVINWTWLRLSIPDLSIIMIGPGGLLLIVPTYMQF